MISISSSIMPDFAKIAEENKKKKAETVPPIARFSYDNTLEETNGALKTFQHRFGRRRGTFSIIAYSLLLVAVIVGIIVDPKNVLAYIALVFCLFGLVFSATDQKRTRSKILKALDDMNPEDYCCTIYPDKVEIETIIKPKENEIDPRIDEEADEEIIAPLKSVYVFGDDLLNFSENAHSLLLFFNRQLVYCFPKRCLDEDVIKTVRDFLTEKLENK